MPERHATAPHTLYLIHHSHTDIGYTEFQPRIERWHVDFIRQALRILADSRARRNPHFDGFKWTCETFWPVEKFLQQAGHEEIQAFEQALQAGEIGLSASYLNLTELPDFDLLRRMIARATTYGRKIGVPVDAAMTADINGYSWGFAQALVDNGVENLFSCVHTHHGMFPVGRKQFPFWWETPHGQRVLVWNGEHYHFGNDLGVMPGAAATYLIKDEFPLSAMYGEVWPIATTRIPRYLARLRQEGYPFDFVPVMVSGLRNDNAPPSGHIITMIQRWNETHGRHIRLQMVTLGEFFQIVRRTGITLPVYRGDWPDWWSDGPASCPQYTKIFRQAQRDLRHYRQLCRRYPQVTPADCSAVEYDLTMFAEHTFQGSESVSHPWNWVPLIISARKKAFAIAAYEGIQVHLEEARRQLGAAGMRPDMPLRYRVVNPGDHAVHDIAKMLVHHFEFFERQLDQGVAVWEGSAAAPVAHQMEEVPRGVLIGVACTLAAGEEKTFEVRPVKTPAENTTSSFQLRGVEGVLDVAQTETGMQHGSHFVETPWVRISWQENSGITSWFDKQQRVELLDPRREHGAFTPVYEITPVPERSQMTNVRKLMGRNRKGVNVVRTAGRLMAVEAVSSGSVWSTAELRYALPGTSLFLVELRPHGHAPRVDVTVRINKDHLWEPENLYLALPFAPGDRPFQLWLDKAGAAVRPRLDQLPGTLTDFYSIQEGLAWVAEDYGIALATPDCNLMQLGDLRVKPRLLQGMPGLENEPMQLYAWLMTNYWETNFEAGLGGFHEFRFMVQWGPGLNHEHRALQCCRALSAGIDCFRLEAEG
ncbi:MAG: glycoside hydrolase [candidate division KSB1 bacterium]|nr:glycoside hydrolase [candidate division KSB1 bacterium]MDZ7276347.1 glycoside hydrolase [candidate division KSB1 bacterium]MDZ7287701.1 glycoside hydrolase [candidate division KSB1 bacterium]MDZ7299959.1 glycoside hydrolase [candidate division KSB1 bacterium]MDZ7305712.1 glycoside hydrolase [candidate division KSB1 bacterium]